MPTDGIVHVIDDDDAMRELLAFLLKSAKVKVATYESANEFLARLPQINAGCVVTDVRMPGMSGIELLKHLRDLKNMVPVIVITGHGDVPLAVEAMKFGASDFLEKPFDDDLLLAAVQSALSDQAAVHEDNALKAADHAASRAPERPRAPGSRRAGRGSPQQDHRLRSRHQSTNHRDLPGQRDDQNGGFEPVRAGPHGADGRRAGQGSARGTVKPDGLLGHGLS